MFVYVPLAKLSFTCMYIPQVKAGTIFDNILITDDENYAQEFGDETWGQTKDAEKKVKDAVSKETTSGCVGNSFILALPILQQDEEEAKRKAEEGESEEEGEEFDEDEV